MLKSSIGVTVATKRGHQFLWTSHKEAVAGAEYIKPVLNGVYVATVYREANFEGLGINDPWENYPVAGA